MTLNVRNKRFVYAYRMKSKLRHILKKFYQRLSNAKESTPVFILGSGRSGTDIVSHCLGKAWDAELINESNPRAFYNWRLKGLDCTAHCVEASKAKLVFFKPIVETLRAGEFLDYFPESFVIFVVRNPYDAINSMVRFFGEGHVKAVKSWVDTDFARHSQANGDLKQFIRSHCHEDLSVEDACALYWLLYNSAFHFLNLDTNNRVSLIRYEDLVKKPDETIKRVCGTLGLTWKPFMTDEVYSSSVGKNLKPEISPEIERACLDQWKRLTGERLLSSI